MVWKSLYSVRIKDLDTINLVKICTGGLVLGLSKFPLLPQLPQKMMLVSKVVKSDSKIIITIRLESKSVTHS